MDVRLQRRFPSGGRAGIDGIVEVFNLFNRENFENYVGTDANSSGSNGEVSRNYLAPQQSTNIAYAPRTLQLGFCFAF